MGGPRIQLGELENMVLATVLRLGDGAYGAAIITEIRDQTGRRVPSGSLYVTLDRLESKGLINSRVADPNPKRGGRPKRLISVTRKGFEAARQAREALLKLWSGLESEFDRG